MSQQTAVLRIDPVLANGGDQSFAVSLSLPSLPLPLGDLKRVAAGDRQAIQRRIESITTEMASTELSGDAAQLEELCMQLEGLGRLLCNTFIPSRVIQALHKLEGPLALTTELNDMPWELLHTGGSAFLAQRIPFSRVPVIQEYTERALAEFARPRPARLSAMLAADPGRPPLPFVNDEVEGLTSLLNESQVRVWRMGQDLDDTVALRLELANGRFNILHFAGHGYFDDSEPGNSFVSVLTRQGEEQRVTARQLCENMAGGPMLFLNACQTARQVDDLRDFLYLARQTKSVANLLFESGAMSFVGAQWPVLDQSALLFALAFYQQLLDGETVGRAMLKARQASAGGKLSATLRQAFPLAIIPEALASRVTWANFVLYGPPDLRFAPVPQNTE